jgi:hypothetical protein
MDWAEWTIDDEIAQAKACLRINAPHLLAPEQCVTCDGRGSVVHGDPYSGPGAEDNSGEEECPNCGGSGTAGCDWVSRDDYVALETVLAEVRVDLRVMRESHDRLAAERAAHAEEVTRLLGHLDKTERNAEMFRAQLADAQLMLRAIDSTYWEQEAHSGEGVWRWRVRGPHTTRVRRYEVPRTGPTPEIDDEICAAMRADLGED